MFLASHTADIGLGHGGTFLADQQPQSQPQPLSAGIGSPDAVVNGRLLTLVTAALLNPNEASAAAVESTPSGVSRYITSLSSR